ncbi:MAG TPA: hypothetical protein VGH74_16420 [Planctomycetaceae bacterium]|jgi:outer membrane murein-binding lipoprotein Lpp
MQSFRDLLSWRQAWPGVLSALTLAGCAHNGNLDVVEAELRKQEQAQEELTQQRDRALEDLKVAQSDAAVLRSQLNKHHQVSLTQEQADVVYRAEAIKFNMLLTSGQNRDSQPGDEGLSVMLTPVDGHGDLVKLAGEVELDLLDMTLETDRQRLGKWTFTIDEVRSKWHSGFLSSGYLFLLDWQKRPVAKELTLHARLTIPDGRKFDVTSQVKVDPPASSAAVARPTKPPRRVGPSSPLDGKPQDSVVAPVSATVNAQRPDLAKPVEGAKAAPKPKINPAQSAAPSVQPVRTSDRFTDATIPTVR